MAGFFFKGLLIGLVMALPIGPVGVLCLHRTLSRGAVTGLVSGLGAACADAIFGIIAAFGVQFAADFVTAHHRGLEIFGAIVVAGFGLALFFETEEEEEIEAASAERPASRLWSAFWTTFLVSIANPATLLAAVAAVAAAGMGRQAAGPLHAAVLVGGLFFGSSIWWIAVAASGSLLRLKLEARLGAVRKVSGALLIALGAGIALAVLVSGVSSGHGR